MNVTRDAKKSKNGFYRKLNKKRKVQEGLSPLVSDTDRLIEKDKQKAVVLNNFFASVFSDNCS